MKQCGNELPNCSLWGYVPVIVLVESTRYLTKPIQTGGIGIICFRCKLGKFC